MNKVQKLNADFINNPDTFTRENLDNLRQIVNNLVDNVNNLVMVVYDVNNETGDYNTVYSLSTAIKKVAATRRQLGMRIRFKNESGKFVEYSYCGSDLTDSQFKDSSNWAGGVELVDGGEF